MQLVKRLVIDHSRERSIPLQTVWRGLRYWDVTSLALYAGIMTIHTRL